MENTHHEDPYRDADRLDGKTVVVVGAGQGMGLEAVRAVRSAGAKVICIDLDIALAESAAAEVDGIALSADVTSRDDVHRVFAEIATHSPVLHAVIDVVGGAMWHQVDGSTDAVLDRSFALNYRQAVYVLEASIPLVRAAGGGAYAFVSSVSGLGGAQWHSAYGAAKAALVSLVRSAAVEFGAEGIRVNSVAPGTILTPRMVQGAFKDQDLVARQEKNIPLARFGATPDIANALRFLVTPASAYITGQTIVIDGGVDAKFPHLINDDVVVRLRADR